MTPEDFKVCIYVASHKASPMPREDCYVPLLVGSSLSAKAPAGWLKDNSGPNISDLNKSFCELTGLYWIWKNSKADIVGLVHYRRFFASSKPKSANKLENVLGKKEIQKILESKDIILPVRRFYVIETVRSQYEHAHHKEDLVCARKALEKLAPEYLGDFSKVMKQRSLCLYNMFIARKNLADLYCSWLFPLLFEMKPNLDLSSYSERDRRVFGFVAERLFNVWLAHQNLKIHRVRVISTESQQWGRKIAGFIKRKYKVK